MLETTAQIIVDEQQGMGGPIHLVPITPPMPAIQEAPIEVVESHEPIITVDDPKAGEPNLILEVNLDGQLLGAPDFDPNVAAQEAIVVTDEDDEDDEDDKEDETEDNNDARKSKKNDKWDWESKGAKGFLSWVKERLGDVPRHSGYDTAGLERASSYLERLDNEISKAMRLDLDGELDSNQIEHVRSQIEKGLDMLQDRINKVKDTKKKKRKGKKADAETSSLVKEAQKVTGVSGIYIMAPLFISRIARICVNSAVSAGHDIEDTYNRLVKRYKLTEREQAETMQLLADMGYPLRQDRGFMPDDDIEVEDGMDWNQNFKG
jgi:ElaB/YqjD/DUF883 family membrane-anchored ribosome-binding protein